MKYYVYNTDENGYAQIPHRCSSILSIYAENATVYMKCHESYTEVYTYSVETREESWNEGGGELLYHTHTLKPVSTRVHVYVFETTYFVDLLNVAMLLLLVSTVLAVASATR